MAKGGKKGMKKGGKGKGAKKTKYNSSDFSRVVHTLQNELFINATGNGTSASPSQSYGLYNFSLTTSPRAVQVARAYQEYRIASVKAIFKSCADTFESLGVSTGANPSVPYLYTMIDRTGTFDNAATNSLTLKQAGAKPRRLDDKPITVTWKPTVMIGSGDDASPPGPAPVLELAAAYKTSPWLTTNANANEPTGSWAANSVDHMGLVFAAECPRGPLPVQVCTVSFIITYEFRRPFWTVAPSENALPSIRVDIDKLGNPTGFKGISEGEVVNVNA